MLHAWAKAIAEWVVPNERNRHAWVCRQISRLPKHAKLLDAGCGQQPFRTYCEHVEYFSQDFGEYAAEAGEGLQIKNWEYGQLNYQGNIWQIQEADAHFDAVLCTEVLEHIPYPNETIQEFSRIMKSGGVLLLTAPYACLPHMRPYFYYSGFSREYYQTLLEQHGFVIEELSANGNYFFYLVQENLRAIRLVPNFLLKGVYACLMVGPALLQRLLAGWVTDSQLVFGYHIRAVKK